MSIELHHIGVAVKDAEAALEALRRLFGNLDARYENVEEQKVRTISLKMAGWDLELLEPTSADSPVAGFLEKRGGGVHHLCFRVENLEAKLNDLKAAGVRLIDSKPRTGVGGARIAFVHPAASGGILVELAELPGGAEH